jgi:hypothetical protein
MSQTQDDTLADWGGLLREVDETESQFDGIAPLRHQLQKTHAQAVVIKALRGSLRASYNEATQKLLVTLAEGRDTAHQMRSYIKATLGPRSEALHRYGIKPLRRRRRSRRRPESCPD